MKNRGMGTKEIVGIGGCLLGLAIVYFGSGVGTESPKKEAAARASVTEREESIKPLRAMNFALDNMVFFARELGFNVVNANDEAVSQNKIATRIENQLHNVRELYRVEIAKNPSLAGVILLQIEITPSGEVSQVRETGAKITDSEFKKAVIAEVAKWSFSDIVSETVKVNCPLLFVHQGMDITTLVRWEKATAAVNERSMVQPAPIAKGAVRTAPGSTAAVKTTSAPTRGSARDSTQRTSLSDQVCDLTAQGAELHRSRADFLYYRDQSSRAKKARRLAGSSVDRQQRDGLHPKRICYAA